jgi:hypothetical protein
MADSGGRHQVLPAAGSLLIMAGPVLGPILGWFPAQVHLACGQDQKPLAVIVTAGQRGGTRQFTAVMGAVGV